MDGLIEGRIVHFVMPNGQHRPAIVVKVFDQKSGVSDLQVFTDGRNDVVQNTFETGRSVMPEAGRGMIWSVLIAYSEKPEPGTWHWIEGSQSNSKPAMMEKLVVEIEKPGINTLVVEKPVVEKKASKTNS